METSEFDLASAFIRNKNIPVCLPVVSGKPFMWVYSDQIDHYPMNLQPDDEAELNKAYATFPFPPRSEMAALAQRCSLHPDQVRDWFMLQRLRDGISWDCEDICEIREKLCSSSQTQGENGHQQRMREELRVERREEQSREGELMECGGERAGEVIEEVQVKEERVREGGKRNEKVRGKKQGGREMTEEGMTEERGKRDKVRGKKQGGREMTEEGMTEEGGKRDKVRGKKQGGREMTEGGMTEEGGKRDKVRGKKQGGREMTEGGMTEEGGKRDKVRGKKRGGREITEEGMTEEGGKRDKVQGKTRTYTKTITKTQTQLLRQNFLNCPVPSSVEYDRLVMQLGLPRPKVVKWFCDVRHQVKIGKVHWVKQGKAGRMMMQTWMGKLENSES